LVKYAYFKPSVLVLIWVKGQVAAVSSRLHGTQDIATKTLLT